MKKLIVLLAVCFLFFGDMAIEAKGGGGGRCSVSSSSRSSSKSGSYRSTTPRTSKSTTGKNYSRTKAYSKVNTRDNIRQAYSRPVVIVRDRSGRYNYTSSQLSGYTGYPVQNPVNNILMYAFIYEIMQSHRMSEELAMQQYMQKDFGKGNIGNGTLMEDGYVFVSDNKEYKAMNDPNNPGKMIYNLTCDDVTSRDIRLETEKKIKEQEDAAEFAITMWVIFGLIALGLAIYGIHRWKCRDAYRKVKPYGNYL